MRFVFIFCACFLCGAAAAQKIRFTDPANQWTFWHTYYLNGSSSSPGYVTYRLQSSWDGSVTQNGLVYQKSRDKPSIEGPSMSSPPIFREDTAMGVIYFQCPGLDTADQVYFDYRLRPGDTLRHTVGTIRVEGVVQTLDSVRIGTTVHRIWTVSLPGWKTGSYSGPVDKSYFFIEGIGSSRGSLFPIIPNYRYGSVESHLRCFSVGGMTPLFQPAFRIPDPGANQRPILTPWIDSFDNRTSCVFSTMALTGPPTEEHPKIFPNPGGTDMQLQLPARFRQDHLKVYDGAGRLAGEAVLTGTPSFPIGQLLRFPGVYYYLLEECNGAHRTVGRLIFE